MRLTPLALLLAAGVSRLAAQTPGTAPATPPQAGPTATLTLQEAQSIARRSNPSLQQTIGAQRSAGAQLRSSYGALLPNLDASFGTQYREGRQQFVNGVAFGATSSTLASSYDLTLSARYNTATFVQPKLQRANLRAAEADVTNESEVLRAQVAQQYLTVLQRQAQAQLQDTLLANARVQLELAKARAAVGSGTVLDVRRSEVAVGQQQVALLKARNDVEVEKVRLFQRMGVQQPSNVQLTTAFDVAAPQITLDALLDLARRANPALNATRSRESVANLGYRNAQGQYTPTLTLQSGWGGYTSEYTDDSYPVTQQLQQQQGNCFTRLQIREAVDMTVTDADRAACSAITLTPAQIQSARAANNQFPFSFQRNPFYVQAFLTFPIFNGLLREQRLEEAAVARNNARYNVRATELALTAGVTSAYYDLNTAVEAARIQEQNARTAREALTLAEERYRVGASTFVDVQQARADYERAENDRINAVYDFHKAFAALESAVGRSLR
ncbi:MAG TPA: TolC family protein [Gemmatimonadaceae bacterium]|nr:TolC family protein [Gemmatimonadaceae bacterium]